MSSIIIAIKLMAIDLLEAHLLLRRQPLYPSELQAHVIAAKQLLESGRLLNCGLA